jgi:MFS family permease
VGEEHLRSKSYSLFISIIISMTGFYFGYFYTILNPIADELLPNVYGIPEKDYHLYLGYLHSSFCFSAGIGTLLSGWAAESWGRRATGIIGEVICLMAYALYSVPVFSILMFARLVSGFGAGMCLGIAGNHINELIP